MPWSPDPERFAKLALAPAKVARVFSDPATKTIQAVVDEDQLSLAIGRNGQNVRLASELTGWKIDLYSSREWLERGGGGSSSRRCPEETDEMADVRLSDIAGMPPATVAVLEEAGYRTLNDIIDLEREDFLKLPGIAPEEADRIMAMIDELTTEDSADEDAAAGEHSAEPARSGIHGLTTPTFRGARRFERCSLLASACAVAASSSASSRCARRRRRTSLRSPSSRPMRRRTVWTRSCRCSRHGALDS